MNDNKRVAMNTVFLYLRMLFVMGVTVYTTRVVLDALGEVDYGVYDAVGGLSLSFVFFSSALSNATQRFLNFNHGQDEHNEQKLNQIFNLSLLIYCSMGLLVYVGGSIGGVWLIHNKMIIPPESVDAAHTVLYCTLFSMVLMFIGSVYESVLISRENMKIYAYIGLFDAFSRLVIASAITRIDSDRLAWYAIMYAIAAPIPKIALIIYCRRYAETRIRFYWNTQLVKRLFSFAGWNIYDTGVYMLNHQGMNTLLNAFFGPVVNTAQGIASQVNTAVHNLCISFFTAIRPQIVKRYAAGDILEYLKLIYSGSKFSMYLIWIMSLPLMLRIEFILNYWLKNPPQLTATLIVWALSFTLLEVLNNPLWSGIQAVGRLRKTLLYGSTVYMLAFPTSWVAMRMGADPWIIYPALIIFRSIYIVIAFKILASYVPLSGKHYCQLVLQPVLMVGLLTLAAAWLLNQVIPQTLFGLIAMTTACVVIVALGIYTVGLTPAERSMTKSYLQKLLHKKV